MCLREASSVSITSAYSIVPNPCPLVVPCDKPMELPGWPSTVSTCKRDSRSRWRSIHGVEHRLNIALELAKHNNVYEDIASKFFEAS